MRPGRARIALPAGLVAVVALGGVALAGGLTGGPGPDTIKGTAAGDRISGKGGPDRLYGRGGRDRLRGGKGDDRLAGGGSRDKLKGGKGDDRLRGGGDTDKLFGGKGRDGFNVRNGVLLGSPGDDVIRARDGTADEIDCAGGFDKAYVDRVEDGVYNCEKVIPPDGGDVGGGNPPGDG